MFVEKAEVAKPHSRKKARKVASAHSRTHKVGAAKPHAKVARKHSVVKA